MPHPGPTGLKPATSTSPRIVTVPGRCARMVMGASAVPEMAVVTASKYSPGKIVSVSPGFSTEMPLVMVASGAASLVPAAESSPLLATKYSAADTFVESISKPNIIEEITRADLWREVRWFMGGRCWVGLGSVGGRN